MGTVALNMFSILAGLAVGQDFTPVRFSETIYMNHPLEVFLGDINTFICPCPCKGNIQITRVCLIRFAKLGCESIGLGVRGQEI